MQFTDWGKLRLNLRDRGLGPAHCGFHGHFQTAVPQKLVRVAPGSAIAEMDESFKPGRMGCLSIEVCMIYFYTP